MFSVIVPQFSISRATLAWKKTAKRVFGETINKALLSLCLIANIFHLLLVKDSTGVSSISLLGDMQIQSILIFSPFLRRLVRARTQR